jgi:hypothetical protein
MKKEKQPSAAKAARKSIHERLSKELKAIAAQLQKQGISTIINIEKEVKKLAKKITKGAKIEQPAAAEAPKEKPVAAEVKAPAKDTAPAKPKPAPKAPAKESAPAKQKPAAKRPVEKVAVPVATPEPPAAKPAAVKATSPKKAEKK